jgi:pimeloyl-ACP methyl ester carboxylesterase
MSKRHDQKISFVVLLFLTITLVAGFTLTPYSGFASTEYNNISLASESSQGIAITNATTATTNIVLVHGAWADGSFWSKVIPILQNAGHRVIAVQLPLHSIADDVATVKRAIDLVGEPTILVGHSYGGFVITNAGYNNQNVTGLVYVAAFAPDEGESLLSFMDPSTLPLGFLVFDSGGFAYINQEMFHQAFAQDVNKTEAEIMAAVQKPTPTNQSILGEPSGPPAWKQLPTWYQVSESDHIIPPDAERQFAQRMNATTISVNSSHASPVSHPDEIAQLILDAAKGSTE